MTKNENCGLPILNFGLPKLGFRISNMIWITNTRFRRGQRVRLRVRILFQKTSLYAIRYRILSLPRP